MFGVGLHSMTKRGVQCLLPFGYFLASCECIVSPFWANHEENGPADEGSSEHRLNLSLELVAFKNINARMRLKQSGDPLFCMDPMRSPDGIKPPNSTAGLPPALAIQWIAPKKSPNFLFGRGSKNERYSKWPLGKWKPKT